MATVKGYSVCQSDGLSNAPTVYSYSVAPDLQDGSPLAFDAATPEDAMRTGLSQAYSHGGVACADANALNQFQNEGLTQTLLNAPNATGAATALTLTTAGGGNPNYASCDVVCSTTNISDGDLGAGLLLSFTANSSGVPAGTISIVSAGAGYTTGDVVGIDGFPGTEVTVTV